MPALAMADLKAVLPQAAMHNHDRDVRLEHPRRDYQIPTTCCRQESGLVVTRSPCEASNQRVWTGDASWTIRQPGVTSLHV